MRAEFEDYGVGEDVLGQLQDVSRLRRVMSVFNDRYFQEMGE